MSSWEEPDQLTTPAQPLSPLRGLPQLPPTLEGGASPALSEFRVTRVLDGAEIHTHGALGVCGAWSVPQLGLPHLDTRSAPPGPGPSRERT